MRVTASSTVAEHLSGTSLRAIDRYADGGTLANAVLLLGAIDRTGVEGRWALINIGKHIADCSVKKFE